MKITAARIPCDFDPGTIKRLFAAAWRQAAHDTGWNHPMPKEIASLRLRKGANRPWVPRMGASPAKRVYLYLNPRVTQNDHVQSWYRCLGGNLDHAFAEIPDVPIPKAPPPAKRARREPIVAERLVEARARVAEWEQKRKDAQRALKLAKTKLRSYKAQVRALERSHVVAAEQTSPAELPERAFTASMAALRG